MRPTPAAAAIPLALLLLLLGSPRSTLAQSTRPTDTLLPDPAADQILKDKGLLRAGTLYLLPGDASSAETARLAAKARIDMENATRRRAALEADIHRAESTGGAWDRQYRDLNERYAAATDPESKNRLAAKVNALAANLRQASRFIEQRQKALDGTPDRRDEYITALLQATNTLDAVAQTYTALAEDPGVTAALTRINQTSRFKYRLGPSPAFADRLLLLRKQRDAIENAVVKLEMQGGVPTTLVTINGALTRRMVVDSGASLVTLSAGLAKELKITPAPTDPVVHMVIANGQQVDGRLVHLKSVQLGRFSATDVEAAVLPDTEHDADSLLGGSFLKHFIYRMDLTAGELHLTQLAPTGPAAVLGMKPLRATTTTRALGQ